MQSICLGLVFYWQVGTTAARFRLRSLFTPIVHLEPPVHYLLTYDLATDYLERRGEFRDAHLQLAWEAQERGELILAGALAEPADHAVLVFDCTTPEPVQLFAAKDPYVINGLVRAFHVRQWNTVVGELASNPVRPA